MTVVLRLAPVPVAFHRVRRPAGLAQRTGHSAQGVFRDGGHQRCGEEPDGHTGDQQTGGLRRVEQRLDQVGAEDTECEESEHDTGDAGENLENRLQPAASARRGVLAEEDGGTQTERRRHDDGHQRHEHGADDDGEDVEATVARVPAGVGAIIDERPDAGLVGQQHQEVPRLLEQGVDDEGTDDDGHRRRCEQQATHAVLFADAARVAAQIADVERRGGRGGAHETKSSPEDGAGPRPDPILGGGLISPWRRSRQRWRLPDGRRAGSRSRRHPPFRDQLR